MNLSKKYGLDDIPYQDVFLSIGGDSIGVLIDGVIFMPHPFEEKG